MSSSSSAENVRNKMTVLTAGGAASSRTPRGSSKSKPSSSKPSSSSSSSRLQNAVSVLDAEDAVVPMENANSSTTTQQQHSQLEYEQHEEGEEHDEKNNNNNNNRRHPSKPNQDNNDDENDPLHPSLSKPPTSTTTAAASSSSSSDLIWLCICFLGIMASFVCYGLLLEYTTSGGRKLHELSFLFVTSGLYTLTAAAGRYVRDETPTTIPPARFAVLGVLSMGSTFCSVRSLRYVIYPIQVLAKSCKPVPVMIMGAFMGKRYPARKYFNVFLIVLGVALFMGGGDKKPKQPPSQTDSTLHDNDTSASPSQLMGILLLFISLCFDGGTGAYEDKLMSVHSVQVSRTNVNRLHSVCVFVCVCGCV